MTVRLSKAQLEEFRADLDGFLNRGESGGLDKWLYQEGDPWSRLVGAASGANSNYYMPHVETAAIWRKAGQMVDTILEEMPKDSSIPTVFVRGCGTGEKLTPFIGALQNKINTVILFDLSDELMRTAKDNILHAWTGPSPHIHRMQYDFQGSHNIDGNALGLELGGTMFNMPATPKLQNPKGLDKYTDKTGIITNYKVTQKLVGKFPMHRMQTRLANFAGQFSDEDAGYAVVTVHNNPDDNDILRCYSDDYNAQFVRNIFEFIRNCPDIETDKHFDPSIFTHRPCLLHADNTGNRVVAHMTPVNIRESLSVKIAGDKYRINPSFFNSPINTWLPTSRTFNEAASPYFDIMNQYSDDNNRIEIKLMRKRQASNNNARHPTAAASSPPAIHANVA